MIYRLRTPLWLMRQPRFHRPLVVFQSDDWGQPCVPSRESLLGIWPEAFASGANFWARDARETQCDTEGLADVLLDFRDRDGNHPCFTINRIVCEPAWDLIESSRFRDYASTPKDLDDVIEFEQYAAATFGIFESCLHGAEHVSPSRWLRLLRQGEPRLLAFFRSRTMPPPALIAECVGLGAAYLPNDDAEASVATPELRIVGAIDNFRRLFGRIPRGFVAPNHAWTESVEAELSRYGLSFVQATHHCYASWESFEAGNWTARAFGSQGKAGLCNQVRTVDFEPASPRTSIATTIRRVRLLLERGIPVVVNSHRANYVGSVSAETATKSRQSLRNLLSAMLEARPDLSFVTSAQLDDILRGWSDESRISRVSSCINLVSDVASVAFVKDCFDR